MTLRSLTYTLPKGLAFEVADLTMLQRWAKDHAMRMVVELDHKVEDEEYEEVLAFYDADGRGLRRWIMWRAADHFVVGPMNSRSWRATGIQEAIPELVALCS